MHEMSTDEIDELCKRIAGKGGKWHFDKEHRLLFIDKVIGGSIPKEFIPPIENGVREAMETGVLAGYEMVDCAVVLEDGSYHDVDSSEMAFKIAGSMAFKDACKKANPKLLEPIMRVEVVVPEDYMGPVIADLNSRRGQMQGRESRGGTEIINVQVPLAEMFGYATEIRSRTQGRGSFTMHFSHYAASAEQCCRGNYWQEQRRTRPKVSLDSRSQDAERYEERRDTWRRRNSSAVSRT